MGGTGEPQSSLAEPWLPPRELPLPRDGMGTRAHEGGIWKEQSGELVSQQLQRFRGGRQDLSLGSYLQTSQKISTLWGAGGWIR